MFGNFFKKLKKRETNPSLTIQLSGSLISMGNAQHQGTRSYQEDSFGFSDISPEIVSSKGILAVLADGMGGLSNGKDVSEKVVASLLEWFNNPLTICNNGTDLKNAVIAINQSICSIYCSNGTVTSGSTVVAVLVNKGCVHWVCVGDSRIYIKRDIRLHQINEDHDYQNQLLDKVISGEKTFNQVMNEPQKDSLVSCIGNRNMDGIDYSVRGMPLEKEDVIILCSDGVYNALSNKELAELVTDNQMESCEKIIQAVARKRIPNQDNNTVMTMLYK